MAKTKKEGAQHGAPQKTNSTHTVPETAKSVQPKGVDVDFRMRIAVEFSDPDRAMKGLASVNIDGKAIVRHESLKDLAQYLAWQLAPDCDSLEFWSDLNIWADEALDTFFCDVNNQRWVSESDLYGRITLRVVTDLEPVGTPEVYDVVEATE